MLRNVRALFSPANTKCLGVSFAEPRPFHGFRIGTPKTQRYTSLIDMKQLVSDACKDLKVQAPDSFLILWLALFAGLRRSETDRLCWSDVDFTRKCIVVRPTETSSTKTAGSEDYVEVTPTFLAEFAEFQKQAKKSLDGGISHPGAREAGCQPTVSGHPFTEIPDRVAALERDHPPAPAPRLPQGIWIDHQR